MKPTPNYDRLRDKIDTLTWPTAEEIEGWAKENPGKFGVFESCLDVAISLLRDSGLIEYDEEAPDTEDLP